MKMKIKDVNSVCIIDIEGNSISKADIKKLKELFAKHTRSRRIGIDMVNVSFVDLDFLNFIKDFSEFNKISLFNLQNDVLLALFVLKYDRFVDIYMNKSDFEEAKHTVLYRRLKLVKAA